MLLNLKINCYNVTVLQNLYLNTVLTTCYESVKTLVIKMTILLEVTSYNLERKMGLF